MSLRVVLASAAGAAVFVVLAACAVRPKVDDESAKRPPIDGGPKHAVVITAPAALGALATGEVDAQGDAVGVVCVTCHGMFTEPLKMPQRASDAAGPHAGLRFDHGNQPCANCHAPERVNQLRLADGREISPTQGALLCRQCHGPQARGYDHGAHGGMRGYWDESRGARERNSCLGCHDPHEPAYPQYLPAPPPRDRFAPIGTEPHG